MERHLHQMFLIHILEFLPDEFKDAVIFEMGEQLAIFM